MEIVKVILIVLWYIFLSFFGFNKLLYFQKRKLIFFYKKTEDIFHFIFFVAIIGKQKKTMDLLLSFFNKKRQKKILIQSYSCFKELFSLSDFSYHYIKNYLGENFEEGMLEFEAFSLKLNRQHLLIEHYGKDYIINFKTKIINTLTCSYHQRRNKNIVYFYSQYFKNENLIDKKISCHSIEDIIFILNNYYSSDHPQLKQWFKSRKNCKIFYNTLITFTNDTVNALLIRQYELICSIYINQPQKVYQIYKNIFKECQQREKNKKLFSLINNILKVFLQSKPQSFKKFIAILKKENLDIPVAEHILYLLQKIELFLYIKDIQFLIKYFSTELRPYHQLIEEKLYFMLMKYSYPLDFSVIKWMKKENFSFAYQDYTILNRFICQDNAFKMFKKDYDDNKKNIGYIFRDLEKEDFNKAFKIKAIDYPLKVKDFIWYSTNLYIIKKYGGILEKDGNELFYLSLNKKPYHSFERIFHQTPSILNEDLLFRVFNNSYPIKEAIFSCNEYFIYDIFKILDINQFSIQNIETIIELILKSDMKLEVKLYVLHKIEVKIDWGKFSISDTDKIHSFFLTKFSQEENKYLSLVLNEPVIEKKKRKI